MSQLLRNSLYFNIKDKGIVCVTGCCHQGILKFADYSQEHLSGGDKLYGIFGGPHITFTNPSVGLRSEKAIRGMAE